MTVAGKLATGDEPDFLITYKAFAENEKNIRNYMPNVPYEVLDNGGSSSAGKGADFISALCPCAGLSTLGTGTQEMRDAANHWMFESANHVLGNLKPKVFWGENAPAMYSEASQKATVVRDKLKAIAEANGYTMSFYFTNTQFHGVPQRRHRTFYFFWQGDKVPVLEYFKRQAPTWSEYMAQVPANATQHADDMDRAFRQLRATRFAKYAQHLHGDSFPNTIRDLMRRMNKNMMTVQDWVLRNPDMPNGATEMFNWFNSAQDEAGAKYVDRIIKKVADDKGVWDDSPSIFLPETNFNALIGRTMDAAHPDEHRSLTKRECLHMMALPHDFELVSNSMNHICQNVPVCTGLDLQREVLAYLDGKRPLVDAKVLFQSNFKETVERVEGDSPLLQF